MAATKTARLDYTDIDADATDADIYAAVYRLLDGEAAVIDSTGPPSMPVTVDGNGTPFQAADTGPERVVEWLANEGGVPAAVWDAGTLDYGTVEEVEGDDDTADHEIGWERWEPAVSLPADLSDLTAADVRRAARLSRWCRLESLAADQVDAFVLALANLYREYGELADAANGVDD